jgi:outer membrane protein assembly complex protein YaeT
MRRFTTRALLLLGSLTAVPAFAQSPAAKYVGRPVEQIRLLVENAPSAEPSLLDVIEVRQGQALSIAAIRESIGHLHGLGRFQDVQVDAADAPGGGVVLSFHLIPMHAVQRIDFKGALGLSESLLRRTVVDRYGASPPIGRTADAARALQLLYADHGYLRAKIQPVPEIRHDPDRTLLTFEVDAGARAAIGRVTVEGDPGEPTDAFLRQIDAVTGEPFQRPRLQERLDAYVRRLKQRHFYQAVGSVRAIESEDARTVDLVVSISPGLPITIRFEGDPIPVDRRDDLAPIEREGSVDEDLLEDSETRIENHLRQQGYWKADVTMRREQSESALTIVFDVKRGRQYRVAGATEITGVNALSTVELMPLVSLKPGDVFVESTLAAGASAIREWYRRRGFARVDVKPLANEIDPPRPGEGLIRPAVAVVEGERTLVGLVNITGNQSISAGELTPLVRIAPGDPYYQPRVVEARDALVLEYLNRGFASAIVTPAPRLSADMSRVDLVFEIQEGPQTLVDHILIVGNAHTKPEVILREMQLKPGQPLGLQDRIDSQRRLGALGLFRRVRITELTHGASNQHDILVTVEEAPATSVGYGGGVSAGDRLRATGPQGEAEEHFEIAPRGFFEMGRRNLGGKNRSVSFYTRVSLAPKDAPDDPLEDGTGLEFSEYRVVGTYRQPRWLGPNELTVTGVIEQGVRSTFNFGRKGANVDVVHRLTPALRASARYSFSTTKRFDERLEEDDLATIDRIFAQVRLSGFSGALARDTRDDILAPSRGGFLSAESSLAARALGGEVGFVKTYLQGYWFRLVPKSRMVFATRAAVGLADGFPREVQPTDDAGNSLPGPPIVVDDLPASERFFAGGDTTIRGFALDTVGAPNTISANGFPTGGNAVVIFNGELRAPVWRDLGAVVFVDGGNVFRRVTEFDFGELRGSVGFGVRYKSPIGPIRVDLGFKLDRREILGRLEPRTALHFSLGQAF